jgi:hypothetical protein
MHNEEPNEETIGQERDAVIEQNPIRHTRLFILHALPNTNRVNLAKTSLIPFPCGRLL